MRKSISQEIIGEWYLPDQINNKIPGTLIVRETGDHVLKLHGELSTDVDYHETILGLTRNGPITLYGCTITREYFSYSYKAHKEYSIIIMLEGIHFNNFASAQFNGYRVFLSNLANWGKLSNLKNEYTSNQRLFIYEDKPAIDLATIGIIQINLSSTLLEESDRTSQTLKEIFYLECETIDGSSLQLSDFIGNTLPIIQNFFTLVMNTPIFPIDLEGVVRSNDEKEGENEYLEFLSGSIKIYHTIEFLPSNPTQVRSHRKLLPYELIKDSTNKIFNAWFNNYKKLKPVMDLYFGTVYNTSLFQHHQFLSLMQALESYHRIQYGSGEIMPSEMYENLVSKIFEIVDAELQTEYVDDFKDKFRYLNNVTLGKRIKELTDINYNIISEYIKVNSVFRRSIIEARNNMTHLDDRAEPKIDQHKINKMIFDVNLILETCLLRDLGLDDQIIKEALRNKYENIRNEGPPLL